MFMNIIKPTWRCILHPRFVSCLCIRAPYIMLYKRITKKKYIPKRFAGRILHTRDEGNAEVTRMLQGKEPFAIARYGSNEVFGMAGARAKRLGLIDKANLDTCKGVFSGAGLFPKSEETLMKFEEVMTEATSHLDMLFSFRWTMEDYFIMDCVSKNCGLYLSTGLEPYYHQEPWTKALKGKKVLVIHPFVETIRSQYEKRKEIWGDYELLPEFELYTLKAVQTIAGNQDERFATWFDALEWMYNEALKIPFDVAIIGCGAYGFPLAAKLKQAGKQAIHLGGATQILFGISGNRWDNHRVVSKYINEYWTRPSQKETPARAEVVEGACYW